MYRVMALDLCYNIVSWSSYLEDVVWYCRLMSCICTILNLRGGVSRMPAALFSSLEPKAPKVSL